MKFVWKKGWMTKNSVEIIFLKKAWQEVNYKKITQFKSELKTYKIDMKEKLDKIWNDKMCFKETYVRKLGKIYWKNTRKIYWKIIEKYRK